MNDQTYNPVTVEELVDRATQYAKDGYRLIQIHCSKTPTEMFIIYTFEKEDIFVCENIKLNVQVGDTIPSISGIFFAAFLYENEIHDLYGVNVSGMAVDFQGTFYQTAVKQAFSISNAESKE